MKKISKPTDLVLVLLDIRSVQNTASLFRTADCVGISKMYLVGTTPSPVDRFKRPRADFAKISLGAETSVVYEYVSDIQTLIKKFREEGRDITALEQSDSSIDYKTYTPAGKSSLILGNEVSGVSKEVLEACNKVIEIPMLGEKESLNVSVAGAIALFRILNI